MILDMNPVVLGQAWNIAQPSMNKKAKSPTCCAGPETQHEFNIVHCRVTQYELICFKAVTTQRKKYDEEWMFALVNKCVLIPEWPSRLNLSL